MSILGLELLLGFVIGLSLGLLGGGGSILTVPALVYVLGQSTQAAVTTSLAIVGGNAMAGALFHRRAGHLDWKVAAVFGATGMIVAYAAAGLSKHFSPAMLLSLFGVLMLVVAVLMLRRKEAGPADTAQGPRNWLVVAAAGAGVGLLTGILGVGGGFLIVPALVMLVGLPMYQAVGTSLVIIAANSLAGLAGHLSAQPIDLALTGVFLVAGLAGTLAGARLAARLPAARLRQGFALFVIVLAGFLLADNLPRIVMS